MIIYHTIGGQTDYQQLVWRSSNTTKMSADVAMGMIAAYRAVKGTTPGYSMVFDNIVVEDNQEFYGQVLVHYYLMTLDSNKSKKDLYGTGLKVDPTEFLWLIKSTDNNILYKASSEFIRGFIFLCQILYLDFRDYIVGKPFSLVDDSVTNYQIVGYDIAEPRGLPVDLEPDILDNYYDYVRRDL